MLLSTYNGAAYLEAQLESLRAQTGVSIRLHARDDGSNDDTWAMLQAHRDQWPDLATAESGPNLRASASFLRLLRTAPDADYYAFCDQDDIWLPDKLARAVAAIGHAQGPAAYCSNMTLVDHDLKLLGVPEAHRNVRLCHLLFENVATGCTMMLNPAARDVINGLHPDTGAIIMHDWWCMLVVAAIGQVHYDPQPSLLYRQHGGNVVGLDASRATQIVRQFLRFRRQRHDFYPIHAQGRELLERLGHRLPPAHRVELERFVASKRSWRARAAYALSGRVVRRRMLDALVVRGLILAGWY